MDDTKYILVNREPVPTDLMTWATWYGNSDNRRVALTETERYRVSTVFIGIDHRFGDAGPPLLFETMSFDLGTGVEDEQMRWSTYDEAVAGHWATVERCRRTDTAQKQPTPTDSNVNESGA